MSGYRAGNEGGRRADIMCGTTGVLTNKRAPYLWMAGKVPKAVHRSPTKEIRAHG
jgi:hypothetical protein